MARAQTKKASEYKLCFDGCTLKLEYKDYFLVTRTTLRGLVRDAKAYDVAIKNLTVAQDHINVLARKINSDQSNIFALKIERRAHQKKIYELSRTPWYKHPIFWVAVGILVGAGGTAMIVFAAIR